MDAPITSTQPAPERDASAEPAQRRSIDLRGEFVEAYGARVFLALSSLGAVFLLPFSVNNFAQGRWVLGFATALVGLCLFGNALAISRGREGPFAPVFIFGPALVALGVAMYEQGLIGILWAYAALLLFHFVLPRRTANFYNVAIIALAVAMAWLHLGPQVTVRVGVTMVFTLLFTNIFSSLSDAQRMKEAEQRHRLDLLVRGTNAGTLEWDADGAMRYSLRLRQMLGLALEGPSTNWRFLEFVHPEDRARVQARIDEQFARKGRPGSVRPLAADDYRLVQVSGDVVWVHTEGIAVLDARGRTHRCICSFMDITEQVRAQETLIEAHERVREQARQLERQNAQLQAAMRLREEVERMARHDLRTPLSSIASVPRLMREGGPLDPRREELLSLVEHSALRVLSMVNLSLDLYRMEEGSYRLRPQPIDLAGLARTVATELRGHAESKQLAIELDLPAEPVPARGEELLSYSIVANLMKNAVEAAPDGSAVRVGLERTRMGFAEVVALSIRNRGAVPRAIRSQFFEKYATHGKAGGTGLGAYSARLMARVQDGELQMETDDEAGTTLTLWLPAWQAAADRQDDRGQAGTRRRSSVEAGSPLPALSLLLVDDDRYNLLVLRSLLPTPPLEVREAINGRAAIECVRQARPDVIFLDLQMPVMGGPEAIRHIRELQRQSGQAPSVIVAFSAWDDEATRRQCREAGFDHYVVKPASREEILAVLRGGSLELAAQDEAQRVDEEALALMPEFIDSRRELLEQLREAATSGDRHVLKTTSHMLAGSLGLYGFDTASELGRRIATHAMSGELGWLRERSEELVAQFEHDQAVVRTGVRC